MKHEWKKKEKQYYQPKQKPELVQIPCFKFFSIHGQGNPNHPEFSNYIEALYSLSYAIRMSPKKGMAPEGYFEYTVYPLEGVWDLTDEAKMNFTGKINKDDLVFDLMIRQPDFVSASYAKDIIEVVKKTKSNPMLDHVNIIEVEEGNCVQMLHVGSYDDEPSTFQLMEEYTDSIGLKRVSKIHREIYLSDARKVAPEKLKTILRFQVK